MRGTRASSAANLPPCVKDGNIDAGCFGGTELIMLTPVDVPSTVRLSVEGIVGQGCSVRWRQEGAMGVAFD